MDQLAIDLPGRDLQVQELMAQNVFNHWLRHVRAVEQRVEEDIRTRLPMLLANASQSLHRLQTERDRTNRIELHLMLELRQ